MNKINVKIDIDNIVFSISKSNENEKNLNYTNVINPKKIIGFKRKNGTSSASTRVLR